MKPVSKEYQEKKGKSNLPLYTNFRRREGKGVTPTSLTRVCAKLIIVRVYP